MDGAGPFIIVGMGLASLAGLITAIFRPWWLAAVVGTVLGELAFLSLAPVEAWPSLFLGLLPFVGLPAVMGVAIGAIIRKRAL